MAEETPFQGPNEALGGVSVGDEAVWEREVTQEHVEQYAAITGDKNPLHFDAEYAEGTVFKKPFASASLITHGGIQSGALNALVAMKLPGPGSVFMSQELKYVAPVRVGDTVKAHGKVVKVHAKKPVCTMEVTVTTTGMRKEGGEPETITVLTGTVVVYRAVPDPKKAV
jgi:3-hydroxybutyryl-CoA dehydratase